MHANYLLPWATCTNLIINSILRCWLCHIYSYGTLSWTIKLDNGSPGVSDAPKQHGRASKYFTTVSLVLKNGLHTSGVLRPGSTRSSLTTKYPHGISAQKLPLIFTKAKVHLCGFICLCSWPYLPVTWWFPATYSEWYVIREWNFVWKLSTVSFSRFYFGKFKNYLNFLRIGKRTFIGGVEKVLLLWFERYKIKACRQFLKIKSWNTPWNKSRLQQKLQ